MSSIEDSDYILATDEDIIEGVNYEWFGGEKRPMPKERRPRSVHTGKITITEKDTLANYQELAVKEIRKEIGYTQPRRVADDIFYYSRDNGLLEWQVYGYKLTPRFHKELPTMLEKAKKKQLIY